MGETPSARDTFTVGSGSRGEEGMSADEHRKLVLVVEDGPTWCGGATSSFESYEVIAASTGAKGAPGPRLARSGDPRHAARHQRLRGLPGHSQLLAHDRSSRTARPGGGQGARLRRRRRHYVTKPFSITELCAHSPCCAASPRRRRGRGRGHRVGAASVDLRKRPSARQDQRAADVLRGGLFAPAMGRRESRCARRILDRVWGVQQNPTNRTVDNFVLKLRRAREDHSQP